MYQQSKALRNLLVSSNELTFINGKGKTTLRGVETSSIQGMLGTNDITLIRKHYKVFLI